jgi:cytochrome c-type biogenesis protein CcmH
VKRAWLAWVLWLGLTGLAQGAIDTYGFSSDAERQRFQALTRELRCPKCQNQDLADSNAPIAADLRREILRLMEAGQSDRQIIEFLVDRYGEFVRYRPALSQRTWLLWFGPGLLLLGGLGVIIGIVRRRGRLSAAPDALNMSERERLARLLEPGAHSHSSTDKQRS